jgi:hypothetical protein
MGYVVLKDAVLLRLSGGMLGRSGVTEDWDMMTECRRYLSVLWRSLSGDFWRIDGEM